MASSNVNTPGQAKPHIGKQVNRMIAVRLKAPGAASILLL